MAGEGGDYESQANLFGLPTSFGASSRGKHYKIRPKVYDDLLDAEAKKLKEREERRTKTTWKIVEDNINELSITYAPTFEPEKGRARGDLFEKLPSTGLVVHGVFPSKLVCIQDSVSGEKIPVGVRRINPKIDYHINNLPTHLRMPANAIPPEVVTEMEGVWFPLKEDVTTRDFCDHIWYKHSLEKKFEGNYFEKSLTIARVIVGDGQANLSNFLERKGYKINSDYLCSDLVTDLIEYFGVAVKIVFGGRSRNKWLSGISILYNEDLTERINYPNLESWEPRHRFRYESFGYHEQCVLRRAHQEEQLNEQRKRQKMF